MTVRARFMFARRFRRPAHRHLSAPIINGESWACSGISTGSGKVTPAPDSDGTGASSNSLADQLRGFGPIGIFAILVILAGNALFIPLSAVLVLVWVRASHTPWRNIGYVRPSNWVVTVAVGIVFGITFKFLMKAIVMPLLHADPVNQAYHYLAGNRAAIPAALFALVVGAGFGEETLFRGFALERFGKLIGHSAGAKIAAVVLTSLWFGFDHYSMQGVAGAEQATIVGLVFGAIMALTGQIWILMVAHAAFDLTAYAMIYWNLESDVAHLVFR